MQVEFIERILILNHRKEEEDFLNLRFNEIRSSKLIKKNINGLIEKTYRKYYDNFAVEVIKNNKKFSLQTSKYKKYFDTNGFLHRSTGPAVIYINLGLSKEWICEYWNHGKLSEVKRVIHYNDNRKFLFINENFVKEL